MISSLFTLSRTVKVAITQLAWSYSSEIYHDTEHQKVVNNMLNKNIPYSIVLKLQVIYSITKSGHYSLAMEQQL